MTQITLALPYALPPAQMAPDLIRALKTPALATLLSRHSELQAASFDSDSRVLPHEAWLASALELVEGAALGAPLAAAAMHGCGLQAEAAQGYWFIVQPAHVQLARTHLLLSDPRQLHLSEADSRALFELARPAFEEVGATLLYAEPGLWFARADDWAGMDTASPDASVAQNLSDWLPEGERARAYRKLQNEIQMLWYEHPVNQAREQRGLPPVNSTWLWGGSHPRAGAPAPIAMSGGADWMQALAAPSLRQPSAEQLIAQPGAVMVSHLIPSHVAGDWSDWLAGMQRIEEEWCAPLLAALKAGRIGGVTLLLSHRSVTLRAVSSRMAQRKFWRAPSLNALLDHA